VVANTATRNDDSTGNPMNKSELPRTDSIDELARFWDIHSLTDFEDELEEALHIFSVCLDAG
jgi:hypothetical protein